MIISSGMRLTPARLSIPTGRATAALSSAASATVAVSFGFTFATAPRVGVSIPSASFSSAAIIVAKPTNITTTGFTLLVYTVTGDSVTASGIPVDWWAIPV